jgi:ribonuclease Z
MSLRIVFLGTGGSIPTPKRNLPAILMQYENEQFLLDCGEGVQRQIIRARTGFHKRMRVFITHMHGDHMLGLPGLMQTMALLDRERKLHIYGPVGIKRFLEGIKESVQFVLTFPIEIHEIEKPGIVCDEKEYFVLASRAKHIIPAFAYAFVEKDRPGRFYPEKAKALGVPEGPLWGQLQHGEGVKLRNGRTVKSEQVVGSSRKGRRVVYTGDTRPFKNLVGLAADADVLIHDATLDDELAERAKEDGHSTPNEAATTAKEAKVKQLVLTHISARYDDSSVLLRQARKLFKNTAVAEDFLRIDIPPPKD